MNRALYFEILPYINHKNAIIICGMRQVGKTSLMRLLYDITDGSKLWFDFDNPLDHILFEAVDYNQVYFELKKLASLKDGERLFELLHSISIPPFFIPKLTIEIL